jgi:hypothetical protein
MIAALDPQITYHSGIYMYRSSSELYVALPDCLSRSHAVVASRDLDSRANRFIDSRVVLEMIVFPMSLAAFAKTCGVMPLCR